MLFNMFRVLAVLACAGAVFASTRRSPHADLIEKYYVTGEIGRFSDNLREDALLDVPGLISKYGYPVEVHNVVTEDGYILEMQRIPYGRDSHNVPDPNKPVVLVMHGLMASAADWVLMGPGTALAYTLADAGFDVWLGNARGTYYSRQHQTLDPASSSEYWQFSWEEIGTKDLPAMIDYALQTTGNEKLHYIGHSQGTTVFWAMASLLPEYNDKILSMQAYAPVAYLQYNENRVFIAIAPYWKGVEYLSNRVGKHDLLTNNELFARLGRVFCSDGRPTQPLCSNALFLIAGRSEDMHNATMLPVKLAHTPAGSSVRQIIHYGQHIRQNYFRRYDHGSLNNWNLYRSFTPPSYDLSKVTAPTYFHYVENDVFAHMNDMTRLYQELGNPVGMFRVPHPTFSHLDFMWGTEAKSLLYERTIDMMKAHSNLL